MLASALRCRAQVPGLPQPILLSLSCRDLTARLPVPPTATFPLPPSKCPSASSHLTPFMSPPPLFSAALALEASFPTVSSFPNAFHSAKSCSVTTSSMRCTRRDARSEALKTQPPTLNMVLSRVGFCLWFTTVSHVWDAPGTADVPKINWMN